MGKENEVLEILDLVREKVLSPDQALPYILSLFNVVEQSEQSLGVLPCHHVYIQEDAYWSKCARCGAVAPIGQR